MMTMIPFKSDYMEGAHPLILQRLQEMNFHKNSGYGTDPYCESARAKIREACQAPSAQVHFLVGGTQTNMLVIDAMCRFNDGVIAATTGHINVHESGAIEACGHKVVPVDGIDGKIDLDALERYLTNFYKETAEVGIEHYVMPRAIYISTPTELGTVYTLPELQRLRTICDTHGFYLYIDGARLGYALAAEPSVTLPHIARLADAFYIGGTKVGALFGEAVVITNPNITFTRGLIKHRGAMLAKGWLLGVQFDTLMTNDLYLTIARNAVAQAQTIKQALVEKGYEVCANSSTNQLFFVISNDAPAPLQQCVDYIAPADRSHSMVRICTSWATTDEQVEALISLL